MRVVELQTGYVRADFDALISSGAFHIVDCYTITLRHGERIVSTTAQRDVLVTPIGGGIQVQYKASGLKIAGLKMNIGLGASVDTQDISLEYLPTDSIQGLSIATALLYGRFDGAIVTRDRFFAVAPGMPWVGGTRIFTGKFSELGEITRSHCKATIKSDLVLLNVKMPKVLYQPSCKNQIYDAGCKLNRALFATQGIVGAGSTTSVLLWSGAAATMALGLLQIESSSNVTMKRTIKSVVVGVQLNLSSPLDEVPATGRNFIAYQGCDRSLSRCTILGNQANHFAYPFVPVAETAY